MSIETPKGHFYGDDENLVVQLNDAFEKVYSDLVNGESKAKIFTSAPTTSTLAENEIGYFNDGGTLVVYVNIGGTVVHT